MITTTVDAILREGAIGNLRIGSSRHEVRTRLGEPLDRLNKTERASSGVWKYESLQFFLWMTC